MNITTRKIMQFILFIGFMLYTVSPVEADVCKAKCREGIICLERGPCEPINRRLLDAARHCSEDKAVRYKPITKLLFVDIFSSVLRLDKEFPENIYKLKDLERYKLETRLLSDKGIDIFSGNDAYDNLTKEGLAAILGKVTIEKDLGYSSGLEDQLFDLENQGFIIYEPKVYVDEGTGHELWERRDTLEESLPEDLHYTVKVDSCNDARIVFGDNGRGRIPVIGSRLKASYKLYGKEGDIVTECEVVMLLSNQALVRSIKNVYNPSRPLTNANFADLLIKTMHLDGRLPRDFHSLREEELYVYEIDLLSRNGIKIFQDADPDELLTREDLARVLYDSPVGEVVGISNGKENQSFELDNAGFVIYDLHVYVNEEVRYEEWNKKDNFMESSSKDKDYIVRLDAGNYANIYFGDNKKAKIPSQNSPIKVSYRLYAPLTMLTEDDIICVLGKLRPVAETYTPPLPPPEFPPPTDGFDDPATHI